MLQLTVTGREDLGGRRPPRRLAVTTLLLPVVVALGTACSGAPADDPAPLPSAAPPHLLPPIYSAVYDTEEVGRQISAAQGQLIARCMKEAGFTYPAMDPAEVGAPDRPKPFGLESLEQPLATRESPASEKPGRVDKAYIRALYGDESDRITAKGATMQVSRPAHGCQTQADTRLLGEKKNLKRWSETRIKLYEAEVEAQSLVRQDPEFKSLNARWATCMKRAGFTFRDPLQVLEKLPAKAVFRTEPSARADLTCKDETDYLRSAYTGLARAQRHVLTESPELLTTWKSLLRRQSDAARQVLAR
ncbi:hypothetical protein [Streptomyces lomondensis]|uniref:Lipoprotein n=1 Tax=Streptomyces lomondensis TaxID=68229 RepID=A0ABQ2XJ09_9ACTN|nr:hypothetical protein [Streptomyces lomondensis]MCF0079580.1 hypothetical protein [Streptomyces lomondensis]GGX19004.1 hypothetical protein GCM10010383_56270 [Streptomyces lomondensis]